MDVTIISLSAECSSRVSNWKSSTFPKSKGVECSQSPQNG